jgi:hypothetical protein
VGPEDTPLTNVIRRVLAKGPAILSSSLVALLCMLGWMVAEEGVAELGSTIAIMGDDPHL